MSITIEFLVPSPDKQRLDKALFLLAQTHGLAHSRERLKLWIEEGCVQVDEQTITKPSFQLKEGQKIFLSPPPEIPLFENPRPAPFQIIFEDDDLLVIQKPTDLVTHPGAGTVEPTLVEGLIHAGHKLSPVGAPLRPGIVHRLDRGTSGLMVIAKSEAAHHQLTEQFKNRQITKIYEAVVIGTPSAKKEEMREPIGRHPVRKVEMAVHEEGKEAHSRFFLQKPGEITSLLRVQIFTGRTHQIRVHLAHYGLPILGDTVYGKNKNLNLLNRQRLPLDLKNAINTRTWLRSAFLGFDHPITKKPLTFDTFGQENFESLVF